MQQVLRVESSFNPFAIGVVGGRLKWQPRNLSEAVATVLELERRGMNYSIGAAQINRQHFARIGWTRDIRAGFDVCSNVREGKRILLDCYQSALNAGYPPRVPVTTYGAVNAAVSCYYSGRLATPVAADYVGKVLGPQAAVVSRAVKVKAAPLQEPKP